MDHGSQNNIPNIICEVEAHTFLILLHVRTTQNTQHTIDSQLFIQSARN